MTCLGLLLRGLPERRQANNNSDDDNNNISPPMFKLGSKLQQQQNQLHFHPATKIATSLHPPPTPNPHPLNVISRKQSRVVRSVM